MSAPVVAPATTPRLWPLFALNFFRDLRAKTLVAEIDVHCQTPKLKTRLAEVQTWPDGDTLIHRFWESVEEIKAEKAHGIARSISVAHGLPYWEDAQ